MEDSALEALLTDLESDRVERKASASDADKIGEAICAFSNDLPDHRAAGVLFVGANDGGGCAGLPVTDELLRNLAAFRGDGNILPIPSLVVEKRTLRECDIAVILVQPSDAPPVRYKGRTWIRVGPRRAIASPEEERRLSERRRAKDLPFDLRPISLATLADLDLEFFEKSYLPSSIASDVLAQNQRSLEEQLASFRFVSPGPAPVPTVTGLLAIGRDPRQFLGGAYIQFLRIDGTGLADPIRGQKAIGGRLPEMLRMLDEVLAANTSTAVDITSNPIEQRRADYPIAALQQVIRNAVMHRNYEGTNAPVRVTWFSDRIEVLSPGGPFGQVTPENFGTPGVTDYRNRHLAEVLRDLGYVQRFGVGIEITRREMARNGNPPPEFQATPANVLAILRPRP
ncbi:MAG TPA: ATP-binding protein [Bryobacteraceae bacterium]|jgi:ATP-dependent DNA helicase RecG